MTIVPVGRIGVKLFLDVKPFYTQFIEQECICGISSSTLFYLLGLSTFLSHMQIHRIGNFAVTIFLIVAERLEGLELLNPLRNTIRSQIKAIQLHSSEARRLSFRAKKPITLISTPISFHLKLGIS